MVRKLKTSPIEDLLEMSSNISWKISLAIAILSYLGFHYAATLPTPAVTDIHSISNVLYKQIFITLSNFLQYLIPIVFVIGAVVSVFKRKHRDQLLKQQSSIETIRAMSWQDFELLVGEAFRRKGFEIKENGGGGADGGIDLILYKNGRKSIVQCKRWKNFSINVSLVRELYGIMTAEAATECIFVTSGTYTSDARLFADNKPIWLIDGPELMQMVGDIQTQDKGLRSVRTEFSGEPKEMLLPSCPLCGTSMVRRLAKRGSNAGNEFWGCSRYPACKGTSS